MGHTLVHVEEGGIWYMWGAEGCVCRAGAIMTMTQAGGSAVGSIFFLFLPAILAENQLLVYNDFIEQ